MTEQDDRRADRDDRDDRDDDRAGWLPDPERLWRPPPGLGGGGLAVVGASGGLGASTLTLALTRALALPSGASGASGAIAGCAVAVDLALAAGGLDVSAGVEHLDGVRWGDLARARGAVDGSALTARLPGRDGARVLSAGGDATPEPTVVDEVLAGLRRAGVPLVLDLPRGSPDWVARALGADRVLLLTGLTTRALADADAAVGALLAHAPAGSLAVVSAGPTPSPSVIDALERHTGVGHAGHLARDGGVAASAERGEWPGRRSRGLARLAERLLAWAAGGAAPGRAA